MHGTSALQLTKNATRHVVDEALFRLLVERVIDYAIFLLTPGGEVASWNAGAERLKGYTEAEIIGQHFSRFFTEEDCAQGRPTRLLAAAEADGRAEDQGWCVRKDGTRFWADIVITALRNKSGDLVGFAKITRDLTDEIAADERVRQTEQRFGTLVDSIMDYAIFLLAPDGTVLSWNQGAQRIKGYAPSEIIGRNFEQFYTEEARNADRPRQLLAIARATGRVEDEGWRVRKDGRLFWADVVITALHDDAGQLIGYAKVTRDLSDRRAADEQLRQSEERFRTLVDSIKDYAIFLLSPEGIVLSWNQGAQKLKGYTAAEIIGRSFEWFYPEEARATGRPKKLLAIARAEGRVEDEGWRVRKDGTRFWADVVITALHDEAGQLIGYAKVTRDLTERKQAEENRAARLAAERAAERMERLQVATAALAAASRPAHAAEVLIDVALRALDAGGGVIAVPTRDRAALEVLDVRGYAPTILRRHQQMGPEDPYPLSYAWRTNQPVFLDSLDEVRATCPQLLPVLSKSPFAAWAAIPLTLDRRVLGVLGLSFDESRHLDADERGFLLALGEVAAQAIDRATLYESEQVARADAEAAMRAQDEFLSVAAHELRTPVAAVKATAQLAERGLARGQLDPDRLIRNMQGISRAADRLTTLIEDLLDVSRLRTGRLQLRRVVVDLVPLLEETVGRYRATESQHQFPLMEPGRPVLVSADPLRLDQVLDNLLSNAVKYSPNGGSIEVAVECDDEGVTLRVTDHGIGLPPGQETRIFDAFGRGSNATAKQIQGLGLGLAICRELIELHDGRIWATSRGEGQGTTFRVWLPSANVGHTDHQDRFSLA